MAKYWAKSEVWSSAAIVAIMGFSMGPVFASSQAKDNHEKCLDNLKQLGTGIAIYCADYDDYFPYAHQGPGNVDPGMQPEYTLAEQNEASDWILQTQPYLKNYSILSCPVATNPTMVKMYAPKPAPVSLGINGLITRFSYTSRQKALSMTEIAAPAMLALAGDSAFVTASHPAHFLCAERKMPPTEKRSTDFIRSADLATITADTKFTRHNGSLHVVRADTSAKKYKREEAGLIPGKDPRKVGSYNLVMNPVDSRMNQ